MSSSALGQAVDLKNIHFGIEADEFVNELENFISGVLSRSQLPNQDVAIEARLGKDVFYHLEEDEAAVIANSNDRRNPEHTPTNQMMLQYHEILPLMSLDAEQEDLGQQQLILREYVTQKMPIRLLCFEPHNSNLKISLLERTDVYTYLAHKFRRYFIEDPEPINDMDWWFSQHAGYAILSHTWNQEPGELTYGDWRKGSLDDTQPKCRKLVNFCKAAWENHGLALGWVDTVCINKESSAELDESIRSMYAWYRYARVCITYLSQSKSIPEMHDDPWFTRGWTLQELLAPACIKFYNMDWNQMSADYDDKMKLTNQEEISLATTITSEELQNISRTSISRRMQLAAKRQVTRREDMAYCLMGIFDVSISTAYGEGAERAFFRLVEEIFRSTKDVSDIFNWAGTKPSGRQPTTSLFPSRPSDYLSRSEGVQLRPWHPIESLTLTHFGLRTTVLLMPTVALHGSGSSFSHYTIGNYQAAVSVAAYHSASDNIDSFLSQNYLLLEQRVSVPEGGRKLDILLCSGSTPGIRNVKRGGTRNQPSHLENLSRRITQTACGRFLYRIRKDIHNEADCFRSQEN